jgi:uncharacterized membrane protein
MFLKKAAASSESKKDEWGRSVMYLGIGLAVLSLIFIGWSIISQTEPAAGRGTTLVLFGVPAGVTLVIIGAAKTFRDRRR